MQTVYERVSGGTLLFVGDDVDVCLLVKAYFLRKGCRVFIVHTLENAFDSISRIGPDLVIVTLAVIDNKEDVTNTVLQKAQNVQLIVVNGEVTFDKKA